MWRHCFSSEVSFTTTQQNFPIPLLHMPHPSHVHPKMFEGGPTRDPTSWIIRRNSFYNALTTLYKACPSWNTSTGSRVFLKKGKGVLGGKGDEEDPEGGKSGGVGVGDGEKNKVAWEVSICPWGEWERTYWPGKNLGWIRRTQNLKEKFNSQVKKFENKQYGQVSGRKYFDYACTETEIPDKMWQLK